MFTKLASFYEVIHGVDANGDTQGLTKTIPGTPKGATPVHEVENPIHRAILK